MDSIKPMLKYAPIVGAVLSLIAVISVFLSWFGLEDESTSLWKWGNEEGDRDTIIYIILLLPLLGGILSGAAFALKDYAKMLGIGSIVASLLALVLGLYYFFDQKSDWDDLFEGFGDDAPSLKMGFGLVIFAVVLILNIIAHGVFVALPSSEEKK